MRRVAGGGRGWAWGSRGVAGVVGVREGSSFSSVSPHFGVSEEEEQACALGRGDEVGRGPCPRGLGPFLFFSWRSSRPSGLCPCGLWRSGVGYSPEASPVAVPLFSFSFPFSF